MSSENLTPHQEKRSEAIPPFDPHLELRKVLFKSKQDRPAALADWKGRYHQQKEGLMRLYKDVVAAVRSDPHIPVSELEAAIARAGATFGMSSAQKNTSLELLKAFEKHRTELDAIEKKYPDPREFFKAVTGEYPVGTFVLKRLPLSFSITSSSRRDIARLWNANQGGPLTIARLAETVSLRGFALHKTQHDDMNNKIIVIPNGLIERLPLSGPSHVSIQNHEEQHLLEHIFRPILDTKPTALTDEFLADMITANWKGKAPQMKEYIARSVRGPTDHLEKKARQEGRQFNMIHAIADVLYIELSKHIEKGLRDELLAQFAGEALKVQILAEFLIHYFTRGSYRFDKSALAIAKAFTSKTLSPDENAAAQTIAVLRLKKQFRSSVMRGTNAMFALKKLGYSTEEVLAALQAKKTSDWPKEVKRMRAQKALERETARSRNEN